MELDLKTCLCGGPVSVRQDGEGKYHVECIYCSRRTASLSLEDAIAVWNEICERPDTYIDIIAEFEDYFCATWCNSFDWRCDDPVECPIYWVKQRAAKLLNRDRESEVRDCLIGIASDIQKSKYAPRAAGRNPFYYVADVLGVSCADRTDEVISENMIEALRHEWMKLPIDYDSQPVRPGEAVNVSTSYGSDDWRFAKVMGIGEYNHVVLDVPGHDYPQDVNAHSVREAPAVDDYGNEIRDAD